MREILVAGLIAFLAVGTAFAQAPVTVDPLSDPYLRELVRRSKGSNESLATSISDALRLKLDDLASDFLTSLAKKKLEPAESAKLARQISGDRLLRVVLESQFSESAKAQAKTLLDALRTVDQSTDTISPAIEKLTSESPDEQLPALRTVLAGGNESIALLSVAAVKQTDEAKRDNLLRVLLRLGDGGPAAVRQLAIYGQDSIRARALAALIRLGAERARPVVVAAAHDPNSTADEKAIADAWLLRRYPAVPTHVDAEGYLVDRLAAQRELVSLVDDVDAPVELWTIGDDRLSVKHTTVTAINAAWRDAVDQSRLLHRLGDLSPEATDAGVAAAIAYRYQLDPLLPIETGKEVAEVWGEAAVSAESLSRLIEAALRRNDLMVAVAAMELLDDSMAGQVDSLLTTYSEIPTPLVVAASHPQPRVRYQAAAAIGRLGFASAYAGSSDVMKRWIEMASLSREPIVMLIETRLEVAGQIERLMKSMGYRVEIVARVAEAVLSIDRGGDLRFIISTTVLPDRSALELVDAVRRRPLGRDVPIILHGPIDGAVNMAINDERWEASVSQVELPASAAGWSLLFEPLEKARSLPSLSAVDRFDFRSAGANSLGRIASQPDAFAFYEFDKLAGVAISDAMSAGESSSVAFGEPLLAVLSVAASRDAQVTLADLAIRRGVASERQAAAANALLQSFARDGVLLAGDDLLRITRTRQTLDGDSGKAIDRVLTEIGRRSDVGGITTGSIDNEALPQPDKRVRPPDI